MRRSRRFTHGRNYGYKIVANFGANMYAASDSTQEDVRKMIKNAKPVLELP